MCYKSSDIRYLKGEYLGEERRMVVREEWLGEEKDGLRGVLREIL
jgi:hypothetical protein